MTQQKIKGFPSPAQDSWEPSLSFDALLVKHAANTFRFRYKGDSLKQKGICKEDILVVDRSIKPKNGDIVVARCGALLLVRCLEIKGATFLLHADNQQFVLNGEDTAIFGTVTAVVRLL